MSKKIRKLFVYRCVTCGWETEVYFLGNPQETLSPGIGHYRPGSGMSCHGDLRLVWVAPGIIIKS